MRILQFINNHAYHICNEKSFGTGFLYGAGMFIQKNVILAFAFILKLHYVRLIM